MKILITGANGMLAQAVKEKLKKHDLILADSEELDITNKELVLSKVKEIMPNYIINCAAYTAVDKAEDDVELAKKVNAGGPTNLAIASKETNSILIHISTDYVFDGELSLNKEYEEDDETNPVTVYGRTKLEGEEGIQNTLDKFYIFRTAWLYGDGNNFVRTMLKLGKEKDCLNVVSDQNGSPTYTEDLANIIKQVIEKPIPYGIYHTTNLGFTTWYEFTKKIFEIANISCNVNPVTTDEYIKIINKKQANRPKNSKLSKEKILSQDIMIPNWEEALKRYLERELNVGEVY